MFWEHLISAEFEEELTSDLSPPIIPLSVCVDGALEYDFRLLHLFFSSRLRCCKHKSQRAEPRAHINVRIDSGAHKPLIWSLFIWDKAWIKAHLVNHHFLLSVNTAERERYIHPSICLWKLRLLLLVRQLLFWLAASSFVKHKCYRASS